jgi:hypothetical protein
MKPDFGGIWAMTNDTRNKAIKQFSLLERGIKKLLFVLDGTVSNAEGHHLVQSCFINIHKVNKWQTKATRE